MVPLNAINANRMQVLNPICAALVLLFGAYPSVDAYANAYSVTAVQETNARALVSKGIYWYEQGRFDLANQSFNKAILINPNNANALKWHGMTDLARGEVDSARLWADKLKELEGPRSPAYIELRQAVELSSTKRQQFAEFRYLASSDRKDGDIVKRALSLFPEAPIGEAAILIYRALGETTSGRALAKARAAELRAQFPLDPRYRKLVADLGAGGGNPNTQTAANTVSGASQNTGIRPAKTAPQPTINPNDSQANASLGNLPAGNAANGNQEETKPEGNDFQTAQGLNDQGNAAVKAGKIQEGLAKMREAVGMVPGYAWFRFDLATTLDDQKTNESAQQARAVMDEGLAQSRDRDMLFASALLAARQDRGSDGLALLAEVPKADWTEGMIALEGRISYGQYLTSLRQLERTAQFNALASNIEANPRFNDRDEIKEYQQTLRRSKQTRLRMSYEENFIDGSEGISKIKSQEIPIQLDIPLDYEKKLFLRADSYKASAGRVDPNDATNFAQIGTVALPATRAQADKLDQNFSGYVIGAGIQTDTFRADIGGLVGDVPIQDWVGGIQWKKNIGDGSLRIDIARRMVGGSALSATGAIDPITGSRWGGAKRNGISAVYYTPLTPTLDFVGIAKANYITGRHIPDNTELNTQGILTKTVFQGSGQRVDVGASLYLWSFQKNLRLYTFGQAGYYSPQAFGSFTIPVTWTGSRDKLSWRLQFSFGASESREDDADLYPLDPTLAANAGRKRWNTRELDSSNWWARRRHKHRL